MTQYTRKQFLRTFGASLGAPLAGPMFKLKNTKPGDRPNILLMMTDDSSPFSYNAYGNKALRLPHLDQFATEGMRFNRAYCSSPQCSPARASVLTGQMPCRVYASRLHSPVPGTVDNIVKHFNRSGYYTGAYGKTHQAIIQKDFHFYANYLNNRTGEALEPFTTFFNKKPKEKPFFLWFGSWDPHRPYNKPKTFPNKYKPSDVTVPDFLPDTLEVRQDIAFYYNKLYRFDQDCGRLLSILEERGWADNTIVVQTSDHGMPFPRAKATLYEPGIKVPLIVRWPGMTAPGSTSDALVSTMDLPATWLEAAGLPIPDRMQSRSFLPVLKGENTEAREYVFSERDWHDNWDPMRCVIGHRYKLIQRFRPEFPYIPSLDIAESLSNKSILKLMKHGNLQDRLTWYRNYHQAARPELEFYDLKNDPNEWNNLTGGPHQKEDQKELVYQYQVELSQWMQASNDFLPPPRMAFPGGPDSRLNKTYDPLNSKAYD